MGCALHQHGHQTLLWLLRRKDHAQDTLSARDRGNTSRVIPSYCRLLGCWCGYDRRDEPSIHASLNRQIRHKSMAPATDAATVVVPLSFRKFRRDGLVASLLASCFSCVITYIHG